MSDCFGYLIESIDFVIDSIGTPECFKLEPVSRLRLP